ncbi:MAG: hypothetical protein U9P44_00240, partial [archaeon]|nr:hypothetical protein [archaeon]
RIMLQSKIEHIKKELDNYKNTDEVSDYTLEFVETQIKRLRNALKKQQSLEKDFAVLNNNIDSNNEQLKTEKEKMKLLESKRPKLDLLKKLDNEIEEFKTGLEKLHKEEAKIQSKTEEENESIERLEKIQANCPVCETELDFEKKTRIISKKRKRLEEFENNLIILNKEIFASKEKIEKYRTEQADCLRYINLERDILESSELIKDAQARQQRLKTKLEQAKADYSPEKIRKFEDEIRRFENTKTIIRYLQDKKTYKEEEKQIRINMEELNFNPKKFEEKKDDFNAADKLCSTDIEKVNSMKSIFEEKLKNFTFIEKQIELIKENENKTEKIKDIVPELDRFRTVLENTQILLREQFIESINHIMDDLWESIYPYNDYTSTKISIEAGDYILQLRNIDNAWINVEGTASGGERMSAVLALRIAMSLILAPNLKILLLDEPTHNLDRKAVDKLAETLQSKVSKIIGQTFLITHDEAMESAVTGKLYRLNRGEKKEDMTEVIEII